MIRILPEVSEFQIDKSLVKRDWGRAVPGSEAAFKLKCSAGMGWNLSVSKKVGPCFQMGLAWYN